MSDDIFYLVVRITALPNKRNKLKMALEDLVAPSQNEAGCLQYNLFYNEHEPDTFMFFEGWKSSDALAQHLHTKHYSSFEKIESQLVANKEVIRYKPVK